MNATRIVLVILCCLVLTACNLFADLAPTATRVPPSPTQVVPTVRPPTQIPPAQIQPTKSPTKISASPTVTARLPTPTITKTSSLTATPSPTVESEKPEAILILSPGLVSSVRSPVRISGEADPTFEQNLVAKVTGENGMAIAMKATTIRAEMGKRGSFVVDLTFQVSKDQPGRVAVYSTSAKDGGLEHFSSVEVKLLASGAAQLLPGKTQSEALIIKKPILNASVTGGKLYIEGWSGPVFENTLSLVLCGEGGSGASNPFCGTTDNVLARGIAMIKAPDVGQPGAYSTELSYKVDKLTNARLAVYFTSARDGGLLHLASVPVRVGP